MTKDEKLLTEAKDRFKLAQDAETDNRNAWLEDVKFAKLGEQWPDKVKRQREIDGRPCLTVNKLPAFLRQVINDARQNTPQIKSHPVEGGDSETAEILDGLIRNIEYTSNADVAYDTALEHAVCGGFGYFRVNIDYTDEDSWDYDIKIERIVNPLTVYGDPNSTAADASDWRFAFITELVPKDEFESKWKSGEKVDWESYGDGKEIEWKQDETVRVAEYWKREQVEKEIVKLSNGQVMDKKQYDENGELFQMAGIEIVSQRTTKYYKVTQYIITGAEILETNEWAGKYIPIVPVYGDETFIEGKRIFKSLHRDAQDAQREYNYWRTTATELVALAPRVPFVGPKGAFNSDAERWATANTVSHPYLEYDGATPPQRQPLDMGGAASSLQQALNASDDMKSIMGIFDASLGARSNETSGKAILARQREGDVSTYNFIDNLTRAIRYAGLVIVDMIPKIYDKERIIRVIGQDDSNKSVTINAPYEEEGVEKLYDLTAGKYDITVKAGPSFTTQREEAANQMVELLRAFPAAAPVIGDLLAKNLDWPGAEQIADRLKLMLPPQIQKAESQKGIPPEAQALIAGMDQQMQVMKQQMQQGMQMLNQLGQENQKLKLENANKTKEIEAGLEKAHLEAATKLQLAETTGQQDQQEIILKAFMDALAKQAEDMRAYMGQQLSAIQPQSPNITIHNAKPSRKAVTLQAPSGAVYQGVIEEQGEDDES